MQSQQRDKAILDFRHVQQKQHVRRFGFHRLKLRLLQCHDLLHMPYVDYSGLEKCRRRIGDENLKRLWAPWRMEYIKNAAKATECIFCAYPGQNRDTENYILLRNQTCFAILNRFPYSNGHILVVPYRHTAELDDLNDDELLDLMRLTRPCKNLLEETTAPHGFNIGINLGQTA